MSAYWDWVASGGQDETLGPSTWGNEDLDAYGTWGNPNEWVIPFDIRLQDIASSIASIPKGLWNAARSAFTNKDTGNIDWGKLVTLGGAILPLLQGSSNRPVGYQGGIPDYTAVRRAVSDVPSEEAVSAAQSYFAQNPDVAQAYSENTYGMSPEQFAQKHYKKFGKAEGREFNQNLGLPALTTYDPNRRPGSGGRRYFSDVQYVPSGSDVGTAQNAAMEQAQGLAALNAANPAREDLRPIKTMARGGIVGLQDGGFVFPADVVSHLGNGSTDAGLAHLTRKGAVPIRGKGDGMSDSNRTTINGRQPAAVADGEAYLPPRQVQNMGGAEKLYAMMDKIRKDRTGTPKQGRQINPNQYV